jgi:hypothetical protein
LDGLGFFALGFFGQDQRPASAVFVVVIPDKDTTAAADAASMTDWIPVTASSSMEISSEFNLLFRFWVIPN